MSRLARIRAVAAFATFGLLLAVLTLFDVYGDKIMDRVLRVTRAAAVVALCLFVAACQSFDPVKFAEAANKMDPGCGKLVDVRVGTNWFMGWPVPVVTGVYTKACHPEQLQAVPAGPAPAAPGGLVLGRPVG